MRCSFCHICKIVEDSNYKICNAIDKKHLIFAPKLVNDKKRHSEVALTHSCRLLKETGGAILSISFLSHFRPGVINRVCNIWDSGFSGLGNTLSN